MDGNWADLLYDDSGASQSLSQSKLAAQPLLFGDAQLQHPPSQLTACVPSCCSWRGGGG